MCILLKEETLMLCNSQKRKLLLLCDVYFAKREVFKLCNSQKRKLYVFVIAKRRNFDALQLSAYHLRY